MVYNSSPPSRTKEIPHYVMTGRQLNFPVDFSGATVLAATEISSEMQAVWERVRQYLKQTQSRTKLQLINMRVLSRLRLKTM